MSQYSRRNFSSAGPLRNERIEPEGGWPKADPLPHEAEMPLGQKMVLLKLRRGELAAAILEKLAAMSAPQPAKSDWVAMIDARYIRRDYAKSQAGTLELMPAGLSKAGEIMRDLAPKYGIHLFTRSGGKGSGLKSRCSCTWASTYCRDSRAGESKIRSAESWHIKMVEQGTWKPPAIDAARAQEALTSFLNTIAPPRLNFSGDPGSGAVGSEYAYPVAPNFSQEATNDQLK